MRGVIQQARPSKSGKTLGVQMDGKWMVTKLWELQNHVGKEIVCETETSNYKGTEMTWLNSYTLVDGGSPQQAPQATGNKDRSIITQSLAKATLSPTMTNQEIEARVAFLWELAGRIGAPQKAKPELSEPLTDPEFGGQDFNDDIPF